MRICYLCTDSGVELAKHNGSASHLRGLVGSFVQLGHRVDLLISRVEGADELGVRVRGIPDFGFPRSLAGLARDGRALGGDEARSTALLRALRRIWRNGAVERVLADELRRHRPQLVYERHSPFGVAGAVLARKMGLPHVLEVNAPLAWEGARHRGQALNDAAELLEDLTLFASSRIVVVSEELRDWLVRTGVDAAKVRVVPNGVDHARFDVVGPTLPAGLDDRFVVGFVGSLKAWHGLEVLAEAFAELAEDPRLHLLVVGDGPQAGVLRQLAERLPGRVTLAGAVHPLDVPAHVRAMDVAVAPYPRLERFYFSPLKVLEYMAAGRAVVASRIGQLERLLRDGDNGLLVEPGDAGALVGAVRRLASNAELHASLGRRAADDVRRNHGWKQRAEEILELARQAA